MLEEALKLNSNKTYGVFVTTDSNLISKLDELKKKYKTCKILTVFSPESLSYVLYLLSTNRQ